MRIVSEEAVDLGGTVDVEGAVDVGWMCAMQLAGISVLIRVMQFAQMGLRECSPLKRSSTFFIHDRQNSVP